jgi:hypothetical protein
MAICLPTSVHSSSEVTKALATHLQKPVAAVSCSFSRMASIIDCIANVSTVLFSFVSLAMQLPNSTLAMQDIDALTYFLEDSIDGCNVVIRLIPDFPQFAQDAAPLLFTVIPADPPAARAVCLGSANALLDFRRLYFL